MTLRCFVPVAIALGLSLVLVRDAHAIAPCGAVCGPASPCALRCYLPNHFVTTCGEVGRCRSAHTAILLGSAELDGEPAACRANLVAPSPTLAEVVAGWVRLTLAWLDDAARFAVDRSRGAAALVSTRA